jgi:hypothetical protein
VIAWLLSDPVATWTAVVLAALNVIQTVALAYIAARWRIDHATAVTLDRHVRRMTDANARSG